VATGPIQEGLERTAGRTADPSTSLRDDKGSGVAQVGFVNGLGRNASLDRSLGPAANPRGNTMRSMVRSALVSGRDSSRARY